MARTDGAADGAHQMMVVVAGQVLGELETCVLVVGDDAVHHPGLLEDHERAVDAALGEAGARFEDLREGQGSGRVP